MILSHDSPPPPPPPPPLLCPDRPETRQRAEGLSVSSCNPWGFFLGYSITPLPHSLLINHIKTGGPSHSALLGLS
ncbi:hypothetical protein IAQ61_004397 [Plenodomus lingam]|uniref:uncharacterized protein n=1 Tax=Leptosphaeria maculans TaxID=5022 RepID=UPI00332001C3|nr:hypothetical protein IAQ61_004397 [Plenodomus lingam]